MKEVKQLPLDEETLKELLEMGKSMEDQARKVFMMSEAFAQRLEKKLGKDKETAQ